MRTVIFSADFKNLDEIRDFVGDAASEAGFGPRSVYAIQLATDEACSNIIEHAYAEIPDGEIECTCNLSDEELVIMLRDHGRPFDIGSVPDPDLSPDLEKRQIGGLGIYLMRKLMDKIEYECTPNAGNILTMKKRLEAAHE